MCFSYTFTYIHISIITQVLLDPVPPPEPDPRPPPPPPEPQFPAPAGPQVFVVRRGAPGVGPRPVLRPPIQAQPIPAQPIGLLQEILRQQQVLRLQQEALQQQQQIPAAQGAPAPQQPEPVVPDLGPPANLNALQAWQLDWQQQQHLQRQHLQPFLADQPVAAAARPARVVNAPPPPGAIHPWEQETASEREKRHQRYKTMADASSHDKKAVQQQASAMVGSVFSQERIITYLRTLDLPADDPDGARDLAELIDTAQAARKDLLSHFEFLGVAHDHEWDAAKIYKEEPDETASKRVQAAVAKAKKKREASERDKQKKKQKRSSSSSSSNKRRSDAEKPSCSHSSTSCCPPPACHGHSQPYQKQFRSQNLPCIRCGDTAHHWRQCPKPATK